MDLHFLSIITGYHPAHTENGGAEKAVPVRYSTIFIGIFPMLSILSILRMDIFVTFGAAQYSDLQPIEMSIF